MLPRNPVTSYIESNNLQSFIERVTLENNLKSLNSVCKRFHSLIFAGSGGWNVS